MRTVLVFFLLYIFVFAVSATAGDRACGADIVTGITASHRDAREHRAWALPRWDRCRAMPICIPVSKVILTLTMWVGRLEVVTVLALMRPEVWRDARWRDR